MMTSTGQNTIISPNSPERKSPGNTPSPKTLEQISKKNCRDDDAPPFRPPAPRPPPPPSLKSFKMKWIKQILHREISQKRQNIYKFFLFVKYIAVTWCESNEAYLSNVFFTESARAFIRFLWFDNILKFV